ncbi:hypothetical protein [Bradyrhizobium sp. USDA 3364]
MIAIDAQPTQDLADCNPGGAGLAGMDRVAVAGRFAIGLSRMPATLR